MASNSRHFLAVAVLFLLTPFIRAADDPIEYTKKGCRVVWTITEKSDATLLISRPLKNRGKATDSVIRHDDGTVEFQHDFESNDACRKASVGKLLEGVHFSERHNAILMTPKPTKGSKGQDYTNAGVDYAMFSKLPLTIEYEFESLEQRKSSTLVLNLRNQRMAEFPSVAVGSENRFESAANIGCRWFVKDDEKGKPVQTWHLQEKDIPLNEPKEFNLKLPVKADEELTLNFQQANTDAMLTFISVRGRLRPRFGIGFDDKNKEVIATKVFPHGLGDTIGVKTGDAVISINNNKPASMKEAMELLAKIQFGEQSEIVVKRSGKTVKIGFTAE